MRRFEYFAAEGDGVSILVEIINGEGIVIMIGDYYHDKISCVVDGYLRGIREYATVGYRSYSIDIEDDSEFDWEEARNREME